MKTSGRILVIWLFFAATIHASDTTQFRVDSYIPKYFRDFEWSVQLGAVASGFNNPDKNVYRNDDPTHFYDYEGKNQNLDLSMFHRFRRITVPSFLDISLRSELNWEHNESHTSDSLPGDLGAWRFSNGTRPRYSLRLNPVIDVGVFLAGDMFVSVSSTSEFQLEAYHSEEDRSGDIAHSTDYPETHYRDHYLGLRSIHNGRFTALVAMGIGRLYGGQYAFSSLSMVDELNRRGMTLRNPSYLELRALTDTVYYYRLKHGFDKREQRIRALTSIAQYLASAGISGDSCAPIALAIEDVWDYFPQQDRLFGARARIGLNFRYRNSSVRQSDIVHDTDLYRFFNPGDSIPSDSVLRIEDEHRYQYDKYSAGDWSVSALLEFHKPLSLHWQCDISASASYSLNDYGTTRSLIIYWLPQESRTSSSRTSTDDNSISGEGRIWFTYLVDARTSAAVKFTFLAGTPFRGFFDGGVYYGSPAPGMSAREDWNHSRQDYLTLAPSFTKRLAVPTTLTLSATFKWDILRADYQDYTNFEHRLSYSVGATLSHQIF